MGLLAMGRRALGCSSGFAVYVGNDDPGPQRIRACSPGEAEETACGILGVEELRDVESPREKTELRMFWYVFLSDWLQAHVCVCVCLLFG